MCTIIYPYPVSFEPSEAYLGGGLVGLACFYFYRPAKLVWHFDHYPLRALDRSHLPPTCGTSLS